MGNDNMNNNEGNSQESKNIDFVENAKNVAESILNVVSDAAKTSVDFAGKQLEQAKVIIDNSLTERAEKNRIINIEKYKPIFEDSIPSSYPNMIHVVNNDIRMKVKECEGAVGFKENIKGIDILGIYQRDYKFFKGIEFLPDKNPTESIYYVHPLNEEQYINISDYFHYLEQQRVAELENLAQDLGAKYFKVEILEEQTIDKSKTIETNSKLSYDKDKVGISIKREDEDKQYKSIKVLAENRFTGGKSPREPQLFFWQNNVSITNLIKQRLSNDNPLQSKVFILDYNTSTGIKEKEGANIDGVLRELKFNISGSVQKKASSESTRRLAYTIEF